MHLIGRLTLALALSAAPIAQAAALPPAEIFAKASQSIVVVETQDARGKALGQGSGVVVGPGLVVTNCHVLKSADSAHVSYKGRRFETSVRHIDMPRDLCSIDVAGLVAPSATIGTSELRVGEKVYTIGAPQGLELTLGEGLLSSRRGSGTDALLQVSAPISQGSSGGGLFDEAGRLIGITTMYLRDSQQLNFAVPVEWISELPARHKPLQAATSTSATTPSRSNTKDAARAAADAAAAAAEAAADAAADADDAEEANQRWHEVDGTSNFDRFLDSETYSITGNRAKVWVRDVRHKVETTGDMAHVKETLALWEYDCTNRTACLLASTAYTASGKVLSDRTYSYATPMQLTPESVGESTYNVMSQVVKQSKGR